jgi:hypothetical protein
VIGRRQDKATNSTLLGPLAEAFSNSEPRFARKQCRCIPSFIMPTQEGSEIRFVKFVLSKELR